MQGKYEKKEATILSREKRY